MDVFDNLPQEKRERIINAAMGVFAAHGYHKASAADISKAANISKAMVFTYFGSKRGCYEFMCNEALRISLEEFDKVKEQLLAVTDYFERITIFVKVKMEVLKQYPLLLSFTKSMLTERDAEVRPAINRIISERYRIHGTLVSAGIDPEKFKNPSDAARVGKMTDWLAQGCTGEWLSDKRESIDSIIADFTDCMQALKKYFYKEEYL